MSGRFTGGVQWSIVWLGHNDAMLIHRSMQSQSTATTADRAAVPGDWYNVPNPQQRGGDPVTAERQCWESLAFCLSPCSYHC